MANLTPKEQEKATILTLALSDNITNEQAAKQLGISIRQVQRAKAKIREQGISTVIHQLKGKPSNHRYPDEVKQAILEAIEQKYADFKPKFATEKLQEINDIPMTSQTIRVWMTEKGLWKQRKRKRSTYHAFRFRKDYFGELEQFDGSYHYWLEDRYCDNDGYPIEMCLLASIDDATGKITRAEFVQHEGIIPVFTFWKKYIEEYGKPLAIYLDKFSTYKINHKNALDNSELKTQFQRAMGVLGITVIFANSPQAKGRVERLFQTLQDRLIKDMRLADIKTPERANKFLEEVFIPKFNDKFTVIPTKAGNIHRPLLEKEKEQLNQIFSIHQTRRINNDFTIQFKNNWYQLTEVQPTTIRPKETIIIEQWINGVIHINLRGKYLSYTVLPEKPKRIIEQPIILTTHKLNWRPPVDHPWKKSYKVHS